MSFQLPASVRGFHDYFKLTASPRELTEAFGYSFESVELSLNPVTEPLPFCEALNQKLTYALSHLDFESEMMRREFLIAPILFEVAQYLNASLRSEYGVRVNAQLKGSLDYFMTAERNILIVEAKQGDLSRGFSQLCAELIAVDHWAEPGSDSLYGAVSFGDLWRFGRLDRGAKRISQDLDILTIPAQTERLARLLVGILRGTA